jgi:putative hemolysin
MRRTSMLAAAMVTLSLVLTACGSNNNEESTATTAALANPASAYCDKQGGSVENDKDAAGNEVGVCVLPDGTRVEEWAYYRLHGHGLPTAGDLEGLLVTASDLGEGWTGKIIHDDPNDDPRPTPGHVDPMLCPDGLQRLIDIARTGELDPKTAVLPQVTAELRGPSDTSVNESLWATATVNKEFEVLQHAITTCAGAHWTWEAGDTFDIVAANAPRVGDQAAAFTMTVTPSGGDPHAVHVVMARLGSALMWIDGQSFDAPMTDASWRDIVAQAAVKLL